MEDFPGYITPGSIDPSKDAAAVNFFPRRTYYSISEN